MTRDIWAVVPVKELAHAKQRLESVFTPHARRQFVLAMLADVLAALKAVPDLAGTVVVTIDADVAAHARDAGVRVLTDGAGNGYSGAVNAAAGVLAREGRGGMLAVPADIPLATAAEFTRLLRDHPRGRAISLAPAHDGRGTNAVLLTPPDAMPLEYEGDSFARHLRRAQDANLPIARQRLSGVSVDIDLPADLDHLRRHATRTGSGRALAF